MTTLASARSEGGLRSGLRTSRDRGRSARAGRFHPISYLLLAILAVYSLGPLAVFVFNAMKSPTEISTSPLGPPSIWHWSNLATAWTDADMGAGLANSILISVSAAVGVSVISVCAAYALTRLDLPRPNLFIGGLLVASSLPIQLYLVPLVSLWSFLGLYDNRFGLIVIYWALYSPFATLLVRSFMIAIPQEYEEAARLDGAGEWQLFTRMIIPLVWPGIITAALVAGLQAYNEFLLAVTFIQTPGHLPASLALYSFQNNYSPNWALVSAAGLIMVLPVLVLFVAMQRRFVAGYTSSGMTG